MQTTNLVHLDYRCDGKAHDGCQNGCLIFWHTAWLRPADAPAPAANGSSSYNHADGIATTRLPNSTRAGNGTSGCTHADVIAATRLPDLNGANRYSCQATALQSFTRPLKWWDARAYWNSYRTRNHTLRELINGISFMVFCKIAGPFGERFGARQPMTRFRHGVAAFRFRDASVLSRRQADACHYAGLKAGDYVRIKSHQEILETLTRDGKNRGMCFDAELVPYCGRIFRVKRWSKASSTRKWA